MACAPNDVLSSNPLVVSAGDFVTFFHELKQADYLTACLMHKHFDSVRHRALNAINRSFRLPQPGGVPLCSYFRVQLPAGLSPARSWGHVTGRMDVACSEKSRASPVQGHLVTAYAASLT